MTELSAGALLLEVDAEIEANMSRIEKLSDRNRELELVRAFIAPRVEDSGAASHSKEKAQEPVQGSFEALDDTSGPYSGMTIADAAIAVLEETGPPGLNTHSLIDKLAEGGFRSKAKNVYTSVFATLSREAKKDDTKLSKADGGDWRLRQWDAEKLMRESPVALGRFVGLGEDDEVEEGGDHM